MKWLGFAALAWAVSGCTSLTTVPHRAAHGACDSEPKTSTADSAYVVILAVQEMPLNVRATIVLRSPYEAVIVVPRDSVTPEDLGEAFTVLNSLRKRPFPPGDCTLVRVQLTSPRGSWRLSESEMKSYRGYISSFSVARDVTIPRLGRGRAVEVGMPNWP